MVLAAVVTAKSRYIYRAGKEEVSEFVDELQIIIS
jgi:hypothetical protein